MASLVFTALVVVASGNSCPQPQGSYQDRCKCTVGDDCMLMCLCSIGDHDDVPVMRRSVCNLNLRCDTIRMMAGDLTCFGKQGDLTTHRTCAIVELHPPTPFPTPWPSPHPTPLPTPPPPPSPSPLKVQGLVKMSAWYFPAASSTLSSGSQQLGTAEAEFDEDDELNEGTDTGTVDSADADYDVGAVSATSSYGWRDFLNDSCQPWPTVKLCAASVLTVPEADVSLEKFQKEGMDSVAAPAGEPAAGLPLFIEVVRGTPADASALAGSIDGTDFASKLTTCVREQQRQMAACPATGSDSHLSLSAGTGTSGGASAAAFSLVQLAGQAPPVSFPETVDPHMHAASALGAGTPQSGSVPKDKGVAVWQACVAVAALCVALLLGLYAYQRSQKMPEVAAPPAPTPAQDPVPQVEDSDDDRDFEDIL